MINTIKLKHAIIVLIFLSIASCDTVNTSDTDSNLNQKYPKAHTGSFPVQAHLSELCHNSLPVDISFYNLNDNGVTGYYFSENNVIADESSIQWLTTSQWTPNPQTDGDYSINTWIRNVYNKPLSAGQVDIVYDTTPPTITWSSVSNSSLSPQIIFQINDLRPGSISVTTGPYSSISCDPGANIHLSKDNFSSCIPFASDPVVGPTTNATTEVRIQSNELEQDIEYQLRATTDFSDCAGNSMPTASTSQFRSMNAPPSLNTQITSSNNYTGYAKPGDNITISFVSTDALQGSPNNPKLTLSQLTPLSQSQNFLNPSSDNKTWIVSIKLDNTSFTNNTPQNGTIIHFLIDNYTDLGGLSGPNVTETTDGSYVIYDNQLPGVLSGGKLITDNSNYDNLSKAGDNISMNILTNEPLRSLTGAILGDNATSSNVSDDNWTLKYTTTISNVDNLSASLEFTMEDLAGNTGDNLSANTIAFDNTSPYVVEFQFDNGTIIDNSTNDNISLLLDGFKIKFSETIHQSTVTTNGGSSGDMSVVCSDSVRLGADNNTSDGANKCRELGSATTTDNITFSTNLINIGATDCPTTLDNGSSCPARLNANTDYKLSAMSSITDLAGNRLNHGSDNLTLFSTIDAPTVVASFPDNTSRRSVYTAGVATFSVPMDPSSLVDGTNVNVSCQPAPADPALCGFYSYYDQLTDNLTIYPNGPWPDNTTVTFSVTGGNAAGSQFNLGTGITLTLNYTWSILTKDSLENGLVAHYTLDNNVLDHSSLDGVSNDGRFSNQTNEQPSYVQGYLNSSQALKFDGVDDFFPVTDVSTLQSSDFTISLWIYSDDLDPGTILSKSNGNNGYRLELDSNSRMVLWAFTSQVVTITGNSCTLQKNYWHHLVWTWSSGTQVFFIDGNPCETDTVNGNITHDPNALLLFAATLDSGGLPTVNLLDAILDDIKIYNRVLDSASVFDLFFEENRNLEGYYSLKNDALDYSGQSRDGTIAGGSPTVSGGRDNSSNNAYLFNGNDEITVPYSSSFNDNELTFLFWNNPSSGGAYASPVTSRGTTSNNNGWNIYLTSSNNWEFWVADGSSWNTLSMASFTQNRWSYIAGRRNISNRTGLFRNGTLMQVGSVSTPTQNTSDVLRIGFGFQTPSGPKNYYFKGVLDDIRIYSRALQDKEIESLYNVVDTRPPVPGMNGVITVNNPGTPTPTLNWSNAIDDYASSNALEYLVVRNSTTNKINNSETALRNGVIQSCTPNWTANISSCTVDNQSLNTNYYYTILARDNQGNVSSYNPVLVP